MKPRAPLPPRKKPLPRATKPLKRTALKRPTVPIGSSAPVRHADPERAGGVQGAAKAGKRGKRPKAMSAKRAGQAERRAEVVAEVKARDRTCRAGAVHALIRDIPCSGPLDPHELINRSQWRAGILEPLNVVLVCRSAHGWITTHPNGAHALGLHFHSYERAAILAGAGQRG